MSLTIRPDHDVCVIGAGLIGLAVADALVESRPGIAVAVVDKEPEVATHQSGHNSGVVHSGLYYAPGSLKARLCVEGRDRVYARCEARGIPIRRSGKIVVATHPAELPGLAELERRGIVNGLRGLRRVSGGEIQEIEPAAVGVEALHVPEAGVVDFPGLAADIADSLAASGADILLGEEVVALEAGTERVAVSTPAATRTARVVVNCAGLHSDRVARLAGVDSEVSIVPFRGEYYRLRPEASSLVRALVYPVPDPRFPFLGVHFTRRIDGTVEVGPNAVLALGREHYRGASASWRDVREMAGTRGLWRLAARHWRAGLRELRSSRSRRRYARLAQALIPDVAADDLLEGGSGVRAQALDRRGNLLDDFVIEESKRTIHVLNAPSPGATASLAIGRHVAERIFPLLSR